MHGMRPTARSYHHVNCLKLLFLLRLKHRSVCSHIQKKVSSVWCTLEQITFGYFAHNICSAAISNASSELKCGVEVALCWWCALLASAQPHTITVLAALQNLDFYAQSKQKHSWAWDTVQTPPFEGFPGTSKERDAETRHLLQNEN